MTGEEPSTESRLIHAGTEREMGRPVAPPLVATSTYVSWGDPAGVYGYARNDNATWDALEEGLGALEGAKALVFASGQAASFALVLALAGNYRRLLLPSDGYYNMRTLGEALAPLGVDAVAVDLLDEEAVMRELGRAPAVLWTESPTNPLLRIVDLERLAGLARASGGIMVCDNTVATALLQRPLDLGAVATVTSLTKAVSGHSDVILGAVATRDQDLWQRVRQWRTLGGAIAGPFESFLVLRGLKTLPLRLRRQSESALAAARHLAAHPDVRTVHYPGVDAQRGELARRQMPEGFGPLLSFEVRGGAPEADAVVAAARIIVPSTSFGGVESTWERRARWPSETAPASLIRLSVGVEPIADLIADLDRSLEARGRADA